MKRIFICLLIAIILFSVLSSAYAGNLERGDRGDDVRQLQALLNEKGFLAEPADGVFGAATETAVQALQEYLLTLDLPDVQVTGEADEITRSYLAWITHNPYQGDLKLNDSGDGVMLLQTRLRALNYLTITPDGVFGAKTEAAVQSFQKVHADLGLDVTGVADGKTFAVLFSSDAKHADTEILRPIKEGEEGLAARTLQNMLRLYGFTHSDADGIYGKRTTEAVIACQRYLKAIGHVITVSGNADLDTLTALSEGFDVYREDVSEGSEGAETERLQARLYVLNYMDVSPTGTFAEYTLAALKDFQKLNGLPETGIADRATQTLLYSEDAVAAERPTRRELKFGTSGRTVGEIQERLLELGFLAGLCEENYDDDTANALVRMDSYMTERGTPLNLGNGRSLSVEQQLAVLETPVPVYTVDVQEGDTGSEVYRIQRRLHTLYYIVSYHVDGRAGQGFTTAIAAFQAQNGLEATGIADEKTQDLLFSAEAKFNATRHLLVVSIADQRVYAYELGADNEYSLVRTMICSTGLPGKETATPTGIFVNTWRQHRWHYFEEFDCWAQYTFVINGNILFHSVLYSDAKESTLRTSSLWALGKPASHGCIRLKPEDAEWIFKNCANKTVVIITDESLK